MEKTGTSVEKEATLTSKGQITLPAEIRRALRVEKGDKVVFRAEAGTVTVRRATDADAFARYAGRFRKGEGKTRAQINAELRELRGE